MMNSHYPNSMTALASLVVVVASCGAIPVHGQDASLPENWQSLPVAEFVPLVRTLDAEGRLHAQLRLARVGKFAEARQLLASSLTPDDEAAAQRLADNRAAVDRAEQVYEADRQAQAASGGSP